MATIICLFLATLDDAQWIISNLTLPEEDSGAAVGVYSESIFLIGGKNPRQLLEYSSNDELLIDHGDELPNYSGATGQFYAQRDNELIILMDQSVFSVYNMQNKTFEYGAYPSLPASRDGMCVAISTTHIIVNGGVSTTPSPYTDVVNTLSFSSMTWVDHLPNMKIPRAHHGCTCDSSSFKLYAIGGLTFNENTLKSIEVIDVIDGSQWNLIGNLSISLYGGLTVVHGGMIYIIGGVSDYNSGSATSLVHLINTTDDIVSVSDDSLPFPSAYMSPVMYNNIIYCFGGQIGPSASTNAVLLYRLLRII